MSETLARDERLEGAPLAEGLGGVQVGAPQRVILLLACVRSHQVAPFCCGAAVLKLHCAA